MLHTLLERHWQSPRPVLRLLLRPLSILFRAIATRRRPRYRPPGRNPLSPTREVATAP